MSVFGAFYQRLWNGADALNRANILALAAAAAAGASGRRFLDLGCDDGAWTLRVAGAFGAAECIGVEIDPARAPLAEKRGVVVERRDLDEPFPFPDASFDLVHANQVIEHVPNVDHFVSEIFRVVRPGGMAIVSSENGSAWHNVFAAAMGWQIFSLTNASSKAGAIGNPLALHNDDEAFSSPRTHKTIFNFAGFRDLFLAHGFKDVRVLGAGYHPLPPIVGRWDPRHAHFITACGVR